VFAIGIERAFDGRHTIPRVPRRDPAPDPAAPTAHAAGPGPDERLRHRTQRLI